MKQMDKREGIEVPITGKQMAEIALKMYKIWQKQIKPPIGIFLSFKEWLDKLLKI